MPHLHRVLAAAIGLVLLGSGTAAAQKKVYCWNEKGTKVCGDALPAEAADSARTEISARSGLRTGQVARALTQEERISAALAADVARRQGEAEAMLRRRDVAMVESYVTEADLRRAYGERTELLDESLKASAMGLSNLRLSLLSLLRQAGDRELAGEPVPKPLADSIRNQHDELLRQQQILAEQRKDRAALDAELNEAVARYRILKAPANEAASTATPAPAAAPPR
jgi:hypothetical protein